MPVAPDLMDCIRGYLYSRPSAIQFAKAPENRALFFESSNLHILKSAHPQILKSSNQHIYTSSH